MSILNVEHLSHGFGDRAIFQDVSFRLLKGEHIGLVGANGEGKSTFMSIITGKLQPDEGKVEWAKHVRAGYLDQHTVLEKGMTIRDVLKSAFAYLFEMEEQMNAICDKMGEASEDEMNAMMEELGTIQDLLMAHDFYIIDSKVEEVGRALGLQEIGMDKDVSELSGGQRTKVLLGKLLLEKPDILLLDEPTNHLDIESIRWLETFLMNYKGAVLIVSHDRYFLDRVVSKVVEIFQHKGYVYQGNYSDYAKKKAAIRAAMIKQYYNQQREIRHQEEVIAKLKSFNREKSIKRAESREKLLDKIERIEKPTEDNTDIRIVLEPNVVSGNDVLKVEGLAKAFPPLQLFSGINFEVKRGERVALIGNNGTGKTTILKIINELIPPDAGTVTLGSNVHIGYYDQEHQQLHMEKTIFDEIADDYPNLNNTKVRNVLAAFLFTDDDVYKRIEDLSGGERGRVALAKLMLSDANFLILDEPTNHLDITSKEILEEALKSYTGTVFFVSHDRYFINQTATRILELTGETVVNYIGNYDYYLEKHDQMVALYVKKPEDEAQTEASVKETAQKVDWQTQKAEQARIRKIENALKKAEEKIAELEEKIASIDAECAKPEVAVNSAKLGELTKQQSEYQEELEKQYEVWEELSMELDA